MYLTITVDGSTTVDMTPEPKGSFRGVVELDGTRYLLVASVIPTGPAATTPAKARWSTPEQGLHT